MPAHDTPDVAERRRRLEAWISSHYASQADFLADFRRLALSRGTGAKLAQAELSLLLKPNGKSFGEKKAKAIELTLGMPVNHLLAPLSSPARLESRAYEVVESGAMFGWREAYSRAAPSTRAAIDLLLLPKKEREAIAREHDEVLAGIRLLEANAEKALALRKTA